MTPADRIPQAAAPHGRDQRRTPRQAHRDHNRTVPGLEREIERLTARVAELEREMAHVEAFAAVAAHQLVEPQGLTEAYPAFGYARRT